jgi:hypothetical protein
MRSGAACRVSGARNATTQAVTGVEPVTTDSDTTVSLQESASVDPVSTPTDPTDPVQQQRPARLRLRGVMKDGTSTPDTAQSVPVSQGRLTMSAVAFQVVSGGAGELTVLAPLALRVR